MSSNKSHRMPAKHPVFVIMAEPDNLKGLYAKLYLTTKR